MIKNFLWSPQKVFNNLEYPYIDKVPLYAKGDRQRKQNNVMQIIHLICTTTQMNHRVVLLLVKHQQQNFAQKETTTTLGQIKKIILPRINISTSLEEVRRKHKFNNTLVNMYLTCLNIHSQC